MPLNNLDGSDILSADIRNRRRDGLPCMDVVLTYLRKQVVGEKDIKNYLAEHRHELDQDIFADLWARASSHVPSENRASLKAVSVVLSILLVAQLFILEARSSLAQSEHQPQGQQVLDHKSSIALAILALPILIASAVVLCKEAQRQINRNAERLPALGPDN